MRMKSRKGLTILLALMFVFAMSSSAFAAPVDITAEVQIIVFGEDYGSYPIEVTNGTSLYQAIEEKFGSNEAAEGDLLPVWIYSNDAFWPTVPANFLISFLMMDSIFVDYYPDIINGGWVSESYDWKYTVNGTAPFFSEVETTSGYTFVEDHQKAMNQYIIQESDEIVLYYDFWVEEWK